MLTCCKTLRFSYLCCLQHDNQAPNHLPSPYKPQVVSLPPHSNTGRSRYAQTCCLECIERCAVCPVVLSSMKSHDHRADSTWISSSPKLTPGIKKKTCNIYPLHFTFYFEIARHLHPQVDMPHRKKYQFKALCRGTR